MGERLKIELQHSQPAKPYLVYFRINYDDDDDYDADQEVQRSQHLNHDDRYNDYDDHNDGDDDICANNCMYTLLTPSDTLLILTAFFGQGAESLPNG